jgi:hypothetical protein
VNEFRVIHHEPVCPTCGSFDITEEEVETGDGLTEIAYICRACGEAWPVACVTDWNPQGQPDTLPRNGLGLVLCEDCGEPIELWCKNCGTWVHTRADASRHPSTADRSTRP